MIKLCQHQNGSTKRLQTNEDIGGQMLQMTPYLENTMALVVLVHLVTMITMNLRTIDEGHAVMVLSMPVSTSE